MKKLIRKPGAWLPIAMSLTALALVVGHVALFGVDKEPHDEGAAAHLFQLLMAGQLPVIVYFAAKWLPKKPKETWLVLILQLAAAILAFAPVYFLEL